MLCQLSIRNFTLVDSLNLEFHSGLSAITGETGAGKSILLDALSLTLGDRADFEKIRSGAERAEVTAQFAITHNTQAREWLQQAALDEQASCILRRVITTGGRSQGWINGQPCTMAQLQELGELLISIHGQHEHQNLLRRDEQRRLLDEYADHAELLANYQQAFEQWQEARQHLGELERTQSLQLQRVTQLREDLEELDGLAVGDQEYGQLEQEQAQLAHAETLMGGLFQAQQLLRDSEEVNACQLSQRVLSVLNHLPVQTPQSEEARTLVDSALINLQEASDTLARALDRIELDPQRLGQVEQRLSAIFQLARKLRVAPEQLAAHHRRLQEELAALENPEARIASLRNQVGLLHQQCQNLATQLSTSRGQAAQHMAAAINAYFPALAMPGAELRVEVQANPEHLSANGMDLVEFLICTNPGKSHGPLAKVASGGELSRVSLAIQMVSARAEDTPSLIFDEVDAGIGGATAERVGQLLRDLGQRAQVICVTHLPQVASYAQQQLRVEKLATDNSTATRIELLEDEARVAEIARMLGGQLTPQSLEHARDMLATKSQ